MQKRMKTFLAITLLCFAVVLIVGFYMYNKPHKSVADDSVDVKTTAEKLYDQYAVNEATADKIFLNKVIEVHGEVDAITHQNNDYFIMLKTTKSGGINCEMMMNNMGLLRSIKTGDMLTVKGKCTGFLMDVNLADCIIPK